MLMKKSVTIIGCFLLLFFGCMYKTGPNQRRIADSLRIAREDSIRIADSTLLAYNSRPWKLGTYNDEFGDSTSKKYISTFEYGTFSNSAASDENLYVTIIVDQEDVGILLREYQIYNTPKSIIGGATIKLKNSDDKLFVFKASSKWNQSGGIKIPQFYYSQFIDFIKNSVGEIKVLIYDNYSSSYHFTIDPTGFAEEYNQL